MIKKETNLNIVSYLNKWRERETARERERQYEEVNARPGVLSAN